MNISHAPAVEGRKKEKTLHCPWTPTKMTDAEKEFDGITWQDYLVIAFYFMFVLAVGLLVKSRKSS